METKSAEPLDGHMHPVLICHDDVYKKFAASSAFDIAPTLVGSEVGIEIGIDLLAFTVKGLLEAGVCTRVRCVDLKQYAGLFYTKYKSMLQADGLIMSMSGGPQNAMLIEGPRKTHGLITVNLYFGEFARPSADFADKPTA